MTGRDDLEQALHQHPGVAHSTSAQAGQGPQGSNPLLELHRQTGGDAAVRDEAIARYGFAVPTDEALDLISAHSPHGVVELGAGTGYWAHLLAVRGVDVVAYDTEPAPSATNPWFAGTDPWHPLLVGDQHTVEQHPERTLLLIWPTRGADWAASAIERFHRAGGTHLIYIGEGPGGRTGDDRFHALLGTIARCQRCTYGLTDAPCTCGSPALWHRRRTLALPRWGGCSDQLEVYDRRSPDATGTKRKPSRRRRHRHST